MDPNFIANHLRSLSSASGVLRCPRQNHSKRLTKCTIPARGSFNATNLVKHLSISVDRSCSTLCKGPLLPFFWSPTGSSLPFAILKPWNHHSISVVRRRPTVDDVSLGASITVVRPLITIITAIGIAAITTTSYRFSSASEWLVGIS